MNEATDLMTNVERKPALGSDWVDAHADYLRQPHALSAGFIEYALSNGDVAEEVCYWKDMTLFPHLLNLFRKRVIDARRCFTELWPASSDRKELARRLHSEVVRLKEAFSSLPE